jgi:hypothetical protein
VSLISTYILRSAVYRVGFEGGSRGTSWSLACFIMTWKKIFRLANARHKRLPPNWSKAQIPRWPYSEGWADWAAAHGADEEGPAQKGPEGARKRARQPFLLIQFQDEQKFKFLPRA